MNGAIRVERKNKKHPNINKIEPLSQPDEFLNNAFFMMPIEPIEAIIHKINAVAIGNVAFWHGYNALDGLGITLIINQIVAVKPVNTQITFR